MCTTTRSRRRREAAGRPEPATSIAGLLTEAGHDAIHVRDVGLATAPDAAILDHAADDDRIIVSADTDFGALLAYRRTTRPSVLLVREIVDLPPQDMVVRITGQLPALEAEVAEGAIVVLTRQGARVRHPPLR